MSKEKFVLDLHKEWHKKIYDEFLRMIEQRRIFVIIFKVNGVYPRPHGGGDFPNAYYAEEAFSISEGQGFIQINLAVIYNRVITPVEVEKLLMRCSSTAHLLVIEGKVVTQMNQLMGLPRDYKLGKIAERNDPYARLPLHQENVFRFLDTYSKDDLAGKIKIRHSDRQSDKQ